MGEINQSLVDTWLDDDHLMLLECWARDGIYYDEIAERIGISRTTLLQWRKKYPEINKALNTGKDIIDYKVENALLKAALGYTTQEIKVTIGKQVKNGQTFMITKETITKEIAPNVTAALAWLNNRKPEQWKRNRDNFFDENSEDTNLKVTIVRGPDKNEETNQEITIEKDKKKKIKDKDDWSDWDGEE